MTVGEIAENLRAVEADLLEARAALTDGRLDDVAAYVEAAAAQLDGCEAQDLDAQLPGWMAPARSLELDAWRVRAIASDLACPATGVAVALDEAAAVAGMDERYVLALQRLSRCERGDPLLEHPDYPRYEEPPWVARERERCAR